MTKAVTATCQDNKVKVGDLEITGVTILSQGKKSSTGILFLEGEQLYYVASNATDLHDVIQQTTAIVDKLKLIIQAIGAGMTGPTTAPPATLATDLADIASKSSTLSALKDNLK